MKKKCTGLAKTCLVLAVILLSFGCTKKKTSVFVPRLSPNMQGTVTIAGNYANFEALEAEFDRFNEYYPEIALSFEFLDNYNASIRAAIKTEAAPDIYWTFSWMVDKPEYSGLFELAENLADPKLDINLSAIRQELLYHHQNGQVLMAPIVTNTFGMLVNNDLFKKYNIPIPKTYDDLKKACLDFKEKGYDTPILGYNNQRGLFQFFTLPYFCQSISTIPGSVPMLNALLPEAGKYLKPVLEATEDLVASGLINFESCKTLKNDYNALIMRFFEGDIPIVFSSAELVSGTKKREKQSQTFIQQPFSYSFHPIPVGKKGRIFLNMSSIDFSVNKNSPNLEIANEFMRFLLTEEELNTISRNKRLVTVSTDYSFDDIYKAFSDATPVYFEWVGIMDNAIKQFRSAVWHVGNGKMTSEEAMSQFGSLPEK